MKKNFLLILIIIFMFLVINCNKNNEQTTEKPLLAKPERIQWWKDLKFGLFIHWGPWSQTKIGYIWQITRNDPPGVREKRFDLYKTFNPVKFDPKKWAKVAKKAGMKYVVFVVKHHDGFNNYDTQLSDYKITNPECPFHSNPKADLTKAVIEAFRAEGFAIGLYFSHIDWHHPEGKLFSTSHWEYNPKLIDKEPEKWERFYEYEKGQVQELLTKYGKIDIFWFDIHWPYCEGNGIPYTHPKLAKDATELVKMMRTINPDIIINNRGVHIHGDFFTPEQRIPTMGIPGNWEANLTISNGRGFWYKGESADYKTPKELVRMLIDIVSKGGNFLLNVGPSPEGEITPQEIDRLLKIGQWMEIHSESIYGCSSTVFRELKWGRCTVKGNKLYLHIFNWPGDGKLILPGLKNKIKRAYFLEDRDQRPLKFYASGNDKIIEVGDELRDPYATVVVADIQGKPEVDNSIRQDENGVVYLKAGEAEIIGKNAKYNFGRGVAQGDYIENWISLDDIVKWKFRISKPGEFLVEAQYACDPKNSGSEFKISVGDQIVFGKVKATGEWKRKRDINNAFKKYTIGKIKIDREGEFLLSIQANKIKGDYFMYLKSIKLKPFK